jgi:hypothetical protein
LIELQYCNQVKQFGPARLIVGNSASTAVAKQGKLALNVEINSRDHRTARYSASRYRFCLPRFATPTLKGPRYICLFQTPSRDEEGAPHQEYPVDQGVTTVHAERRLQTLETYDVRVVAQSGREAKG